MFRLKKFDYRNHNHLTSSDDKNVSSDDKNVPNNELIRSAYSQKYGKIDASVDFILFFLIVSNITPVLCFYAKYISLGIVVILLAIISYNCKKGLCKLSYFTETCPLLANIFGLYILASAGWALDPTLSFSMFGWYEENAVLLTLLYAYYRGQYDSFSRIRRVVEYSGFFVVLILVCFVGSEQMQDTVQSEQRLVVSSDENQAYSLNSNAIAMVLLFILTYYFVSFISRGFRIYHLIVVPMIAIIFMTGSRKGFVGFFVSFLFVSTLSVLKYKNVKQIVFLFVLFLGLAGLFSSFEDLYITANVNQRMEGLLERSDGSTLKRMDMAGLGWKIFLSSPLVGCGIGCPRVVNIQKFGWDCYLHNDFIEILAGGGIVGFLLYYSLFLILGIRTLSELRRHKSVVPVDSLIVCSVTVILIFVFKIGSVSYYSAGSLLFSLPLWLCYGISRYGENENGGVHGGDCVELRKDGRSKVVKQRQIRLRYRHCVRLRKDGRSKKFPKNTLR